MGEFRQCLTELSAQDTIMAGYYSLMFLLLPFHNASQLSNTLTLSTLGNKKK